MSLPGDCLVIPQHLKARTAEQLEIAMFNLNVSKGKDHRFFSIQNVNGIWYAWYFDSAENKFLNNKGTK